MNNNEDENEQDESEQIEIFVNDDINESTPLVRTNTNDSTPIVVIVDHTGANATSRQAKYITFMKSLNTENNWTLILGLFWFALIIAASAAGLSVGHIGHWSGGDIMNSLTPINVVSLLLLMTLSIVSLAIAHRVLNKEFNVYKYCTFTLLVIACEIIGSFQSLFVIGLGPSLWCIVVGIICRLLTYLLSNQESNTNDSNKNGFFSLDFYIKISIILLAIDLNVFLTVGPKSLVVGWVETTVVFILVTIIGRIIFGIEVKTSFVLSGCLSICGSSAVVAIDEITKISPVLRSVIITTMSLTTIPAIPLIPLVGKQFGLNNNTLGAWIGGSVDTTGAVSASASLTNSYAFQTAIIVKMVQNIWIVIMVLLVSLYVTRSFSPKSIWDNFPKFIFGFIIVAAITTVIPVSLRSTVVANSFIVSEWFSSIAFILIGYDIDLVSICKSMFSSSRNSSDNDNGVIGIRKLVIKIVICYVIGQIIDILTTFGISYAMFTLLS